MLRAREEIRDDSSPFHTGEQAVQSRVGVREAIEPWARQVVRPYLPEQHREFYSCLPFVVAAARDQSGQPWATLLAGPPGFIQSPDAGHLQFASQALPGDALELSLTAGAEIGLLGIDLETRRRNRVNGRLGEGSTKGLEFQVGQAFGNCPQYITERAWRSVEVSPGDTSVTHHRRLDARAQKWIATADTFFIASGYRGSDGDRAAYGMDASHRGGPAGFVEVTGENQLRFPDYAGNNHFNTIGNLVLDPRVGLLFVDFETGSLLQVSGKATIDWDSGEVRKHVGAQRLVIIDVERVVQLDGVLPLRWSGPEGSVRSLRLVEKVRESEDVSSFIFAPRDDGALPDFEAGQHLPLEIDIDGYDQLFKRTYSLSNGPGEGRYRISVKREPHGIVSSHLHDRLEVGDIVNSSSPDGNFLLEHSGRPVALISAGIGVTPMLSMLHAITSENSNRPVTFVHGARNGRHHPLAGEIRDIAGRNTNVHLEVLYSQPRASDVKGEAYDRQGRISGDLIAELIPGLDADFYLCGPIRFLADIALALGENGVDPRRVHAETFGPAA